jgi:hypothetical protein
MFLLLFKVRNFLICAFFSISFFSLLSFIRKINSFFFACLLACFILYRKFGKSSNNYQAATTTKNIKILLAKNMYSDTILFGNNFFKMWTVWGRLYDPSWNYRRPKGLEGFSLVSKAPSIDE